MIQTHTIITPKNVKMFQIREEFCQLPDGSFLYLADIHVSSVDDNKDYSINPSQRYETVVIHISSDFEYKCYYNTDIKEDRYITKHICCTVTGNVVIYVNRQIRLYRISGGSLQFIKSTDMEFSCKNISFFKNRIYCSSNEKSIILDTNLNITKIVKLFDINGKSFLPCSSKKYLGILYYNDYEKYKNCIICEDSRIKQLKYLRKEGFLSLCMCAATEDSVFIFGEQDEDFKILQVNTDLTVLSEIFVDKKEIDEYDMWHEQEMVFDKNNSRLVIPLGCYEPACLTIYLE